MRTSEEIMNQEITSRLGSEEWNTLMAARVFKERRSRRIQFVGVAASLATAAVILLAILPLNKAVNGYGDSMNSFVNSQLRGTWNNVFANSSLPEADSVVMMEAQYDDSMDNFISTTMDQRW